MRETFDDSESSKYQTLDEHEKIKKLNAWIEKCFRSSAVGGELYMMYERRHASTA